MVAPSSMAALIYYTDREAWNYLLFNTSDYGLDLLFLQRLDQCILTVFAVLG